MSDDGPVLPKTKEIPAVQVPQNTMEAVLVELRMANEKLDSLATHVDVLTNQQTVFGQRLTLVERRQDDIEHRQDAGSLRVKQESSTNLQQDAAIATILTDVTAIKDEQGAAKKRDEVTQAAIAENTALTVEFKRRALGATKHPAVIGLCLAAIAFATHWLVGHT